MHRFVTNLKNGFLVLLLAAVVLVLPGCGDIWEKADHPPVVQGLLELNSHDLETQGPILLSGVWKFRWLFWKSLGSEDQGTYEMLPVPASWNGKNGTRLGEGYGTYELTIKLNRHYGELALLVQEQSSSYFLYVDGKLLASCGEVEFPNTTDITVFEVKPAWCTKFVTFYPQSDEVHIAMQIANKEHRLGGFWAPMRFGTAKNLAQVWHGERFMDVFLAGGLLCIGLLHLIFAVVRRGEAASLYFGLYCLIMATRGIFAGTRVVSEYFDFLKYSHFIRIEYITFYLAIPVFLSYILSVFPRELKRILVDLVWWIAAGACLVVLIFPVRIFTYTVTIYYLVAFLAGTLSLFSLTKAALRKRKGALIILAGFVFVYAALIHDILYATFFLDTGYFTNIGAFIFLIAQSVFLSIRSSDNLDRLLDLSRNLERRVEDRTKQLRNALRLIQNDLNIAREIQKGLLDLEDGAERILDGLRFRILHKPLAEVGGDLYDIVRLPDGRVRIFLADATGHGIQAALITILIRRVYEDLRWKEGTPGSLLSEMGSEFHGKYGNISTYFSAAILEISPNKEKLTLSLAGSPPILVQTQDEEHVVECENPLVGLLPSFQFTDREIALTEHYRILCFTDGLSESARFPGDFFGMERVLAALRMGGDQDLQELLSTIHSDLQRFLGSAEPKDDLLLIGIEDKRK
ncbi:protein phosphatase [Leptospira langatensis]|uniref:Protein phosphatase n=1 Tax=Leptospira langatensis TaxID=2484983 RepID=A0A5F2A0P3_9LEPT|nr:protein phosphatase [Leptospira langatensis]TGL43789.1 protein phosphatase [Leptospira langatensis]